MHWLPYQMKNVPLIKYISYVNNSLRVTTQGWKKTFNNIMWEKTYSKSHRFNFDNITVKKNLLSALLDWTMILLFFN